MFINKKARALVSCLLEVVKILEAEGKSVRLDEIADELKCSVTDLEKAVVSASIIEVKKVK